MCFQFLQSVVHGVQWYVFCFGYTDKMPIIIIFDPSGSCVIFARSIFIIFCLHTKSRDICIHTLQHLFLFCRLLLNKCDSWHTDHEFGIICWDFVQKCITETFVNYPIKRYFIPSRWNPKRHFLFLTVMMLLYM